MRYEIEIVGDGTSCVHIQVLVLHSVEVLIDQRYHPREVGLQEESINNMDKLCF